MACSYRTACTGILAVAVSALALAFTANAAAQTKSAQIDTLLHQLSRRGQFSGSILVAEHGDPIYQNGFGYADIRNGTAFTPNTPCYLASLSKAFTAMAVMILTEEGKLSYRDPLSKYFPEFPSYAKKVTIRTLLNHTSGIPDYVGLGMERPGLTNHDVLKELVHQDSLDFPPGQKFQYSNSGYVLLALIIEKVTGERYGTFMKDHIFEPLGMHETFVRDESHPVPQSAARGYNRFGDDEDYNLLTYGEGGIYSSVRDMFKWDQALYTSQLLPHRRCRKHSPVQSSLTGVSQHTVSAGLSGSTTERKSSHTQEDTAASTPTSSDFRKRETPSYFSRTMTIKT